MSKKEKQLVNNNLVYVLSFLLIIVLFAAIYVYSNFKFIKNDEFKNKYEITKIFEFDDLPNLVKNEYQKKDECKNSSFTPKQTTIPNDSGLLKKIKLLENTNNNLLQKLNNQNTIQDKLLLSNIKIKSLKNENNNLKIIIKNNKKQKLSIPKSNPLIKSKKITTQKNLKLKYKTLMCIDMDKSKYSMTKKCFNDIQKFALQNKSAKYFEVMGMITKDDFSKKDFKSDIIKTGFATKRARVVIWTLREALEFKSKVLPVNYYITSLKNQKGTVIRAYY